MGGQWGWRELPFPARPAKGAGRGGEPRCSLLAVTNFEEVNKTAEKRFAFAAFRTPEASEGASGLSRCGPVLRYISVTENIGILRVLLKKYMVMC